MTPPLRLRVVVTAGKRFTAETQPTQRRAVDATLGVRQMMWLSIDEVVHHHDVIRFVVVRTGSNIACGNSHTGDHRVRKLDPEERKTSITGRGRDKTAEQQTPIGTEELDQRTCTTVAMFVAWTTAIGLIDVSEDRTEACNGRSSNSV